MIAMLQIINFYRDAGLENDDIRQELYNIVEQGYSDDFDLTESQYLRICNGMDKLESAIKFVDMKREAV
jgi:hypothetical protein